MFKWLFHILIFVTSGKYQNKEKPLKRQRKLGLIVTLVKQGHTQHAHSYFCLGVHVPPGVSIWGYMFIFEGTHILELFFHSKCIGAMKSDHLDVCNSDIIML